MQVKSFAECSNGEHSAILSTFIKLPFAIEISIFEQPFAQVLLYLLPMPSGHAGPKLLDDRRIVPEVVSL